MFISFDDSNGLLGTEDDANRAMAQLTHDATKGHLTQEEFLIDPLFLDEGGITALTLELKPTRGELALKPQPQKVSQYKRAVASRALVCDSIVLAVGCLLCCFKIAEVNEIIKSILNHQGALLWQWRTSIISLVTQKLSHSDEQADGEEYQRTLDNQGEAETYLQAYTALLADRRQALINERTLLAAHDQREKKLRHTKAAIKAAANDDRLEIPEDVDLQPEHEVLHMTLSKERKGFLQRLNGRAIKTVSSDSLCFDFGEMTSWFHGFRSCSSCILPLPKSPRTRIPRKSF